MAKFETHFEQVPIDAVKRIIEGERRDAPAEKNFRAADGKLQGACSENDDASCRHEGPMTFSMKSSGIEAGGKQNVNDNELKYPSWQSPLQDLLLEFDREKLPAKIQQVEALIFERLQQLDHGQNGRAEKQAIQDALNLLRVVKRDKLGFPDWE